MPSTPRAGLTITTQDLTVALDAIDKRLHALNNDTRRIYKHREILRLKETRAVLGLLLRQLVKTPVGREVLLEKVQ